MEIKDVIHMYIGQDFFYTIEGHEPKRMKLTGDQLACFYTLVDDPEVNYKLILRRLSDMTEEESAAMRKLFSEMADNDKAQGEIWADQTRHMLKQGFDLFGLCDAGLAIDNKSL